MKNIDQRALLAERFLASFESLNQMKEFAHLYPIVGEFACGEPDEFGQTPWRPRKVSTDPSHLEAAYARLPARFPPLFEHLLLNYRWADVDLETLTLHANPLGPDLSRFFLNVFDVPHLSSFLIPRGYVPFAQGPDVNYDRICFDMNSPKQNREFPIVQIDHEEILCFNRLKIVAQLTPSFTDLVSTVTSRAAAKPR